MSFNMMAKNERKEVIDLLLHGKVQAQTGILLSRKGWPQPSGRSYAFYLIKPPFPVRSTSHSKLYQGIKKIFPDAEWVGLRMSTSPVISMVAKIPTPAGMVMVWRNAWNHGAYNFVTYEEALDQFYFCGEAKTAIEMTRVIASDVKDLPLYINENFHPVAMEILRTRLKGERSRL
jgi:hypothetical protein